eukprot:CAMPEP_0180782696 /NCGR_PEP_ID=MMETSP1038_2-20121128/48520_1 /TAXON_ID=632150 /ORGANISM="Azadinium spinosum, Strain 3D9" /LENGTH=68 /DNA_ID=CAMNT_0022818999 /DNA_START=8 /DNA_END=211 /DNA_ORIENTATION=+
MTTKYVPPHQRQREGAPAPANDDTDRKGNDRGSSGGYPERGDRGGDRGGDRSGGRFESLRDEGKGGGK